MRNKNRCLEGEEKEGSNSAAFIHGLIAPLISLHPLCPTLHRKPAPESAEKRHLSQQHCQPNLCILRK